jgi:hypothetical protein
LRARLKNTLPMAANGNFGACPKFLAACRLTFYPIFCLLLGACAVSKAEPISRIALLAPFEGRYREIGYNALYAARLALQDSGLTRIELLPIDDGGTTDSAQDRARALTGDSLVKIAIILGYAPTDANVQLAFGDIPVLIVGHWGAQPQTTSVYMLANPDLDNRISPQTRIAVTDAARIDTPAVGGDVFALEGLRKLRDSLSNITVLSSASLPDMAFTERYQQSDPFAPEPGLLATLTYDATRIALSAITTGTETRAEINRRIGAISYEGLNGTIQFTDGYWRDAPIYSYSFDAQNRLIAR